MPCWTRQESLTILLSCITPIKDRSIHLSTPLVLVITTSTTPMQRATITTTILTGKVRAPRKTRHSCHIDHGRRSPRQVRTLGTGTIRSQAVLATPQNGDAPLDQSTRKRKCTSFGITAWICAKSGKKCVRALTDNFLAGNDADSKESNASSTDSSRRRSVQRCESRDACAMASSYERGPG